MTNEELNDALNAFKDEQEEDMMPTLGQFKFDFSTSRVVWLIASSNLAGLYPWAVGIDNFSDMVPTSDLKPRLAWLEKNGIIHIRKGRPAAYKLTDEYLSMVHLKDGKVVVNDKHK